jgi:DinB superfamily
MKKQTSLWLMAFFFTFQGYAQETKLWTEADRTYLLDNLTRSRDELINETKGLTKEQWNFKESPDRWSINQIVEHIAIWELLMSHDISRMLSKGPQPELAAKARPDSINLNFIREEKQHITTEYTKPFTYTVPMGLNDLKNNVEWLLKMRNEHIGYVGTTSDDLRLYFLPGRAHNIHQVYITLFGHSDRHLRQLRKVKQHPNYPGKK